MSYLTFLRKEEDLNLLQRTHCYDSRTLELGQPVAPADPSALQRFLSPWLKTMQLLVFMRHEKEGTSDPFIVFIEIRTSRLCLV